MDIATKLYTHRKLLAPGLLLLILIFLATFPLYGSTSAIRLISIILLYGILAVSWTMFSGSTGYMSLAPAAFVGIGIYCTALLGETWPFPAIVALGVSLSLILALLVGLVTLRLKGIYFTIFSFGLVVLVREIISYVETNVALVSGRHVIRVGNEPIYYGMLVIMVATLLVIYFLRRSRWGLAMLSIGGNEEAAAHMGVDTTKVKIITFAISAVFMGAAGTFAGLRTAYVNPHIAFNLLYSFLPILMSVFGGMGQLYGPVIGAILFTYLERKLRIGFASYFMLGFGAILILVILFLPSGLAGLVERGRHRLAGLMPMSWKGGEGEQRANT